MIRLIHFAGQVFKPVKPEIKQPQLVKEKLIKEVNKRGWLA